MSLHDKVAGVMGPVKQLEDHQRVTIEAGTGSTSVVLTIAPDTLSVHNIDLRWAMEPGDVEVIVGTPSRDADLTSRLLTVTHQHHQQTR